MTTIYQAPASAPGEVALLASRETWETVKAGMPASRIAPKITAALARDPDAPAVRVLLTRDEAAVVLALD